jgi:hypothetical protein
LVGDTGAAVERMLDEVQAIRGASFVELDSGDLGAVQLMNFSQTKGREADATVLVFDDDDYFGREREPFHEASRLLYVAMTRARKQVVVLLPPQPHALVAPPTPLLACPAWRRDTITASTEALAAAIDRNASCSLLRPPPFRVATTHQRAVAVAA